MLFVNMFKKMRNLNFIVFDRSLNTDNVKPMDGGGNQPHLRAIKRLLQTSRGFGRFGERLYFCGSQLLRPSKMRQCVLVLLAALFLLAGCRQGGVDSPGLVELDSLIAAAPDSAAARLAAWPADSLRTTQARYKAYIPLDSGSLDTVNVAVAHYADGHDPEKQTRSLLYKGCVFNDMNLADSALLAFNEAVQSALDDPSHQHLAESQFRVASLYQNSFTENDEAVKYYLESYRSYRATSDSLHMLYCLSELAALFRNVNPDTVVAVAECAKSMALAVGNHAYYDVNQTTLAGHYLYTDSLEKAKSIAIGTLRSPHIPPVSRSQCLNIACQALAQMGKADSAQLYLDQLPPPVTLADTLNQRRSMALLAKARGELAEYVRLSKSNDDRAGEVLVQSLRKRLASTQSRYELEEFRVQSGNAKLKYMTWLALLLLLLLLATVLFVVVYRRSLRRRLELMKARDEIAAALTDLHSMNALNELKAATLTRALVGISYLGKHGTTSFKQPNELSSVSLPDDFWSDAEAIAKQEFAVQLQAAAERGEPLKANEMKILAMSCCRMPDAVIAILMNYSNRQSVQNIKSRIAKIIEPNGRSLDKIVADKLTQEYCQGRNLQEPCD